MAATKKPKEENKPQREFRPWIKHIDMDARDKAMELQGWEKARHQIKEKLGLVKPRE
jgi:hypothetical protein